MLDQAEEMMCFAAIIEQGSMTRAAKELKRSKAHISRKLNDLEGRYKVKLFHRTTRSMNLTDAGQKLQRQALQIYYDHKKLSQMAQHVQADLSGEFGISVPDSIAQYLLAPILGDLFKQFPKIKFNIQVTNLPVDLVSQKIDLAIRSGHVGDENLVARQICMIQEKIYAAADNGIFAAEFNQIKQLLPHKLVTNDYSLNAGNVPIYNGRDVDYVEFSDMALINRYGIILDVLKGSDFVAILPEYVAKQDLENGDIIHILPEWHIGEWPLYLIHPFQTPLPHKLKLVSQFIMNKLAAN